MKPPLSKILNSQLPNFPTERGLSLIVKKILLNVFLVLVLLLTFVVVQPTVAQSDFSHGGKYVVRVGDQMVYQFSNLKNQNQDYFSKQITTPQGVPGQIKIVNNMIFTVTIKQMTKSGGYTIYGDDGISFQTTYQLPDNRNATDISIGNFVSFAFTTKENASSYYNQFRVYGGGSESVTIDDTYVTIETDFNNSKYESVYSTVIDWHTGWLQSLTSLQYQDNSLETRYYFSVYDSSLVHFIITSAPLIVGGLVITGIFLVIVILLYNYIKYSKNNNKLTFREYLKEKFIKRHKNKDDRSNINIEKSLDKINDILNDSHE